MLPAISLVIVYAISFLMSTFFAFSYLLSAARDEARSFEFTHDLMAHNVPAVYGILPALVFASQIPGLAKCGDFLRGNEA
jgi:hypothetical protein